MSGLEDTSMTIGGLLARVDRLEEDVTEIKEAQKEILRILHNAEGSWKTMVAIGGAGVAIGAAIAGVIAFAANLRQAFGK
jgi:hypothetical protein